jgi:hypothetical protein
MHLISVILGLIIAWVILFFIDPRKRISYYVQAPVIGLPISEIESAMETGCMPISEIDSAMEAVGLASSVWKGQAEGPSPAPAPTPVPEPSVADMAIREEVPSFGDQDTPSTPQAYEPSPSPS